jgi:glycosyltransferase involved in cell wall biosynthesis
VHTWSGVKLAILMNLAPRKLGSFEGWLLALAAEAQQRGHALDVYGRLPVHPAVARGLEEAGAGLGTLDDLARAPLAGARQLAGYDVLQLHLIQPRSGFALLAYAAWPARVLFMARSDPRHEPRSAVRRGLSRAADAATFARVDSLAAVSEHVREKFRARFGLARRRTRVISNGVDVRRFRPPPGLRAASAAPVLASVAHLVPYKNLDVLLRAFARLSCDARLQIVGDGPAAPDLERLARELGVAGRVELLGLRDDVPELLRRADAYVHPTRYEGFGNAIAEAMASGLAVVATRAGGIPELVEPGVSGILVPPGDEAALAAALERVVRDPELRARLGARARQRILARFTVESAVAGHLDWCEERALVAPRVRRQTGEPRIAAAVSRR